MERRDLAHRQQAAFDFDAPAKTLARTSDKATSKAAAVDAAWKLPKVKRVLLSVIGQEPLTARELAVLANQAEPMYERETYRKRVGELALPSIGYFAECAPRVCQISGKTATTYRRTDKQ